MIQRTACLSLLGFAALLSVAHADALVWEDRSAGMGPSPVKSLLVTGGPEPRLVATFESAPAMILGILRACRRAGLRGPDGRRLDGRGIPLSVSDLQVVEGPTRYLHAATLSGVFRAPLPPAP